MRILMFALSFSIFAPALTGQGINVPLTDFNRILKTGLAVNAKLTSESSYRFTHTFHTREPQLVTMTEVDKRGNIRTTVSGFSRGSVHQAITVGDSVFELSDDGSWTVRKTGEYKAAEADRSAAEIKALAEKDLKTYKELQAKYNPAAAAAVLYSIFSINVMEPVHPLNLANQGAVVTYLGEETAKGRTLRAYRYTGTSPEMLRPGPHTLRADITCWFDVDNGALVRTQLLQDYINDHKTSRYGNVFELEMDPKIVITRPQTGKRGL